MSNGIDLNSLLIPLYIIFILEIGPISVLKIMTLQYIFKLFYS